MFFVNFCFMIFLGVNFGCSDDPDDINGGVINTGQLKTDTLYVSDIKNYRSILDSVTTGGGTRYYLGSSGTYDFKIALRFGIPESLDSVIVKSAYLRMVSAATYGAGTSMNLEIQSIQKFWSIDDLLWDRLSTSDLSAPFNQTAITPTNKDQNLIVPFNRDTIQKWIVGRTETVQNRGILLGFSNATFIQQFYSGRNLTVSGGLTTFDTLHNTSLVVNWERYDREKNEFESKTTYLIPETVIGLNDNDGGYGGYIYRDRSPQSMNTLTVGGGLPYHALLKFDVSKLPSALTVSFAEMLMTIDQSGNYLRNSGDTNVIEAYVLDTDTANWLPSKLVRGPLSNSFDSVHDDTLKIQISSIVQSWASRPSNNFGLVLEDHFEHSSNPFQLYRLKFNYDPVDRERSPKIIIHYTIPPGVQ